MLSYDTEQFLHLYWQDIGSPLALKLSELVKQRNFKLIGHILSTFDNTSISTPERLLRARLSIDIIKKADYLPMNIDRQASCIKTWAEAEAKCRKTNLDVWYASVNHSKANTLLMTYIPRVARFIAKVLGQKPNMDTIFQGFGPGATLSNSRSKNSTVQKLSITTPSISRGALFYYALLPRRLRDLWRWDKLDIVRVNRFEMVPKSYKTDRAIAIEPLVDASIQRSFGLQIARRLRYWGIDTRTAPEKHKELAKASSVNIASWATLDLSSASDTISKELVRAILPREWYDALSKCRAEQTDLSAVFAEHREMLGTYGINQPIHLNEKFSSMGNGYSFELETLIFFAICSCVVGDHTKVHVFGDDIIVPRMSAKDVIPVLESFGFIINTEKSFYQEGVAFRESCGGDYLNGVDVKGVTLKTEPSCINDWYDIHNRLWVKQQEIGFDFRRTLNYCRSRVPRRLRFDIPEYLGVGGFFHPNPKCAVDSGGGLRHYRCYLPVVRPISHDWETLFLPDVILAAALLGQPSLGPLRKDLSRPSYRVAMVPRLPCTSKRLG